MRIKFIVCEICSIQILHFIKETICMRNMNVNGKPASIVACPPNWIIFHVVMKSRNCYLSWKVAISPKLNMLSFSDALEDINQYMQHSMILKFSQTFSLLTADLLLHGKEYNVYLFRMFLHECRYHIYMSLIQSTKLMHINFVIASNLIQISSWYQNANFTM